MGAARRGYILIAVLWSLALLGALAAGYIAATTSRVRIEIAERDRAAAYYAARGACIQAVKDVAVGLRTTTSVTGSRATRTPGVRQTESGGVQVGDLPEFPAGMAAADGLLGQIARKLEGVNRGSPQQQAPQNDAQPQSSGSGAGATGSGAAREVKGNAVVLTGVGDMRLGNAEVRVWIESETGKLDINRAPRTVLFRLLLALGEEEHAATAALQAIETHRIEKLPWEARRETLRRVPSPTDPLLGRPFEQVEQLVNVPGISADLQEKLLANTTVYGSGGVDPNYATRETLRAIGLDNESAIERIMQERESLRRITPASLRTIVGGVPAEVERWLAYDAPPIFTARTRATVDGSVGRYLIRVVLGEDGMPRLLESREDWM